MKQKPIAYTTTLTSKGQFTVPKAVRQKLGVRTGTKFEILNTRNGFFAKPQSEPRIFKMAGIFKKYDDGRPWEEVIEEAKLLAAQEIVKE